MVIAVATVAIILLALVVLYDLPQRKHAILRNFPIVGHFRYWLESLGPELRQYIVTDNNEERPFSRDQRRWVYASSKRENNYFGFGSDNDLELRRTTSSSTARFRCPASWRRGLRSAATASVRESVRRGAPRRKAFRPIGRQRVRHELRLAERRGGRGDQPRRELAGCLQNTGEGGLSPHHLHGGDLIYQIGTGYFGCRDPDGRFSLRG